jgi:hypothetical protein
MSESVAGTVASNASTIQTAATRHTGGRSQGGHGRNSHTSRAGRSNRSNRHNRNNNGNNGNGTRSMFKGNTADMNAHVFECYEERSDCMQFPKTLEALGEYAAKNLKYPKDLQSLFREEMTKPSLVEPSDLPDKASKKAEIIWVSNMKSFARRLEELQSNLTTLYAVIWGQCSEAMRNKHRALDEYESK